MQYGIVQIWRHKYNAEEVVREYVWAVRKYSSLRKMLQALHDMRRAIDSNRFTYYHRVFPIHYYPEEFVYDHEHLTGNQVVFRKK
ncbi:MAG: hypothetical protein AAF388_01900 [Bacteroidota bacterium]